jgi:hypothetical protein
MVIAPQTKPYGRYRIRALRSIFISADGQSRLSARSMPGRRRVTPSLDSLQALHAAASLFYLLRPLTDSAAADTQAACDLGMGEVAFAEKTTTFHPSFFNLLMS